MTSLWGIINNDWDVKLLNEFFDSNSVTNILKLSFGNSPDLDKYITKIQTRKSLNQHFLFS